MHVLGLSDQLLKVFDEIVKLGHLDVPLDDVTRVQEADGLDELVNGVVIFLL